MFPLQEIQDALTAAGLDGWLLYDFRGSNVLAQRILQLSPDDVGTRRYYYYIPASGTPTKLVHRIEAGALDQLPGEKKVYLRWQTLQESLTGMLAGAKRIALEYSPNNAIPYIARVDAGTVEFIRELGIEPVSSGDLIQLFEATWDDEQWQMHLEAAVHTNEAFNIAWKLIADATRDGGSIDETEVRDAIMAHFAANGMETYHPPIVAVGPHSGDPHYDTGQRENTSIGIGSFVLIDLWAKMSRPRSVYSDLTRVGFVGDVVPSHFEDVFDVVAQARDAAIAHIEEGLAAGREIQGWEVDDACRNVIAEAGYADSFVHRTGHSIGQEVHGNGANIDNLETHEERHLMPRTCFSIEPGIYLSEFGIRSEVDVFIDADRKVHVTGGECQKAVLPILSEY